ETLVAGPSEIHARGARDVHLLPRRPAHIAEIEDAGVSGGGIGAPGPGPHGEAEWVPNAIRVDARAHGGEASADIGIAGVAATGGRIDAQHLARQTVDPLRSERADVLGGGGL